MPPDMVCIDSGSNYLVLLLRDDITKYQPAPGRTLSTIEVSAALKVEGIGKLGICEIAMHVPNASANFLLTDLLSDADCIVSFGKDEDTREYYYDIMSLRHQ